MHINADQINIVFKMTLGKLNLVPVMLSLLEAISCIKFAKNVRTGAVKKLVR